MSYIKLVFYIVVSLLAVVSCKEDPLPVSKNQAVISGGLEVRNDVDRVSVTGRTATLFAVVDNEQNREITECGVYYSTIQDFSEGQAQKVVAESSDGKEFSVTIDRLIDGKTYYYYFYVRHSGGLSLSEESSFKVPEIISEPLVAFDENSIVDGTTLYGVILSDGHKEITEIGIEWSLSESMENPGIIEGSIENLIKEDDSYYFNIDAESISETWIDNEILYFKIYAKNEEGTGYSDVMKIVRPKKYAQYKITRLWVTDATTAKMEIKCIDQGIGEITGCGYSINGNKVDLTGDELPLSPGDKKVIVVTDLKDGDNKIFIYGVNSDGISVETKENSRSFSTKILDKYDSSIRYFELDPIVVDGFYCYFLDRNLGARKAADKTDEMVRVDPTEDEVGWLFQWGRKGTMHNGVGHQSWKSENSAGPIPISSYGNHYYKFITNGSSPYQWIKFNEGEDEKTVLTSLWNEKADGGEYNPCPVGYRVPKSSELKSFFNEENRVNMKIVAANVTKSATSGKLLDTQGVCYVTCMLQSYKSPYHPYVWVIKVNNDGTLVYPTGSSTDKFLGLGMFVRPVRVEAITE